MPDAAGELLAVVGEDLLRHPVPAQTARVRSEGINGALTQSQPKHCRPPDAAGIK